MILSVSRRTDIPAFFSEWFFNRVKEGFVCVRNPMNVHQISHIEILPNAVDCIVFWTKNPRPMMNRLSEIDGYNYYFQFTITSYDKSIEKNVPEKKQLIQTFRDLSKMVGKDRVIWRYDPIMLSDKFDPIYHCKWFDFLAEALCGYTNRCVISFVDLYKKIEKRLSDSRLQQITNASIDYLADHLSQTALDHNVILETCSEEIDLSRYSIKHGKCIDDELISKISGKKLDLEKDKNQRPCCSCKQSIDIGAYNTCMHNCLYCYANFSIENIEQNTRRYNPNSPILCSEFDEKDKITKRQSISDFSNQISFIDDFNHNS